MSRDEINNNTREAQAIAKAIANGEWVKPNYRIAVALERLVAVVERIEKKWDIQEMNTGILMKHVSEALDESEQ